MIMDEVEQRSEGGGAANLQECLRALGVELAGSMLTGNSHKTRYMSRGHQIFRIDNDKHVGSSERKAAEHYFTDSIADYENSLLIISDYGKGAVLTEDDGGSLARVLARKWHTVVLDPHPRNIAFAERILYLCDAKHVIIKANATEFAQLDPDNADLYESAPLPLVAELVATERPHNDHVDWIVTCGRRGAVVVPWGDKGAYFVSGMRCRVVHTIGGGDAFMAGLCAALSQDYYHSVSVYFAQLVGQTSVEMPYCGRPTLNDVMAYDMWRRQKE